MAVNTSTKWKIETVQAPAVFDPPADYKKIVQDVEDRAAGAAQIVATIAARDAIPAGELYNGKRVFVLADNSEYVRIASAWLLWSRRSTAFVPTLTGMNPALVTFDCAYSLTGGMVSYDGRLTLTGAAITGTNPTVSLPIASLAASRLRNGAVMLNQTGVGRAYPAPMLASGTTAFQWRSQVVSGTDVGTAATSATTPFTWAATHYIEFSVQYPVY